MSETYFLFFISVNSNILCVWKILNETFGCLKCLYKTCMASASGQSRRPGTVRLRTPHGFVLRVKPNKRLRVKFDIFPFSNFLLLLYLFLMILLKERKKETIQGGIHAAVFFLLAASNDLIGDHLYHKHTRTATMATICTRHIARFATHSHICTHTLTRFGIFVPAFV